MTGASGFIGRYLVRRLATAGLRTRALARRPDAEGLPRGPGIDWLEAPPADALPAQWLALVRDARAVIHLAGLAHRPLALATADDAGRRAALRELRQVNVLAGARLAEAAARGGVRDFLFVSSIKAVAEASEERAIDESTPPHPQDCYGFAKLAAERRLARLALAHPAMRVCMLRPPLVYGPGVKGNFAQLARIIARGWPLPLASVENRRSMIHVGNLVDAMLRILETPDAPGGCYLVCDPQPLSTPALIRAIASARGHRARLLPFPVGWLQAMANAAGQREKIERLTGSLVLDDSRFRHHFGWTASRATAQALADDALSAPEDT